MNKTFKNLVWAVIALPLAYLAVEWNRLPETVALHFNLSGSADQFGSKNQLLLMALILTAVNVGMYLLFRNIYRIDPKKYATVNKTRLDKIGFAVSVFTAALLCFLIYSSAHGDKKFNTQFVFGGVGLLFAFIGNYIHSIKPNYFAGIRLPWTMNNEDNWRKTHLVAGKLFFAGGILITVVCLLTPVTISMISFFTITMIIVIAPCLYSYHLYKEQANNIKK